MGLRLKNSLMAGMSKGWNGYWWLLKILVPISLVTTLLIYSGWLYRIDFIIQPVMGILSLPASAALPILIGVFTGIYGAVAAMAALPLTMDEMILIAIFLLISHSLIVESAVQGRSGLRPVVAALFRLTVSVLMTMAAAWIIQPETAQMAAAGTGPVHQSVPFATVMADWSWDTAKLGLKIFLIIMPLMTALELMKEYRVIPIIVRVTQPILALLGLSRSTGLLWMTAAVFGLSYGGAVIVEETKSNSFSRDELLRLQLSIGINHAMIEDPALFLSLGIPPLWLWIPRLLAAMVAIYFFHFISVVRRLHAARTGHKKLCNHQ